MADGVSATDAATVGQTVSQTGTNANGSFLRLADGTLVCFSPVLTIAGATQPVGTGFISGSADRINWTYPAAFTSRAFVIPMFLGTDAATVNFGNAGLSTASGGYLSTAVSRSGLANNVAAIAIGK